MNVLPIGTKIQSVDYDNLTTGTIIGHAVVDNVLKYIVKLDKPGYMEGRHQFISQIVWSADNAVEIKDREWGGVLDS